jgi:hypothetical protein
MDDEADYFELADARKGDPELRLPGGPMPRQGEQGRQTTCIGIGTLNKGVFKLMF